MVYSVNEEIMIGAWTGFGLDKSTKTIVLACMSDNREECLQSTRSQCQGMPVEAFNLLKPFEVFGSEIHRWLIDNGLTEEEAQQAGLDLARSIIDKLRKP